MFLYYVDDSPSLEHQTDRMLLMLVAVHVWSILQTRAPFYQYGLT